MYNKLFAGISTPLAPFHIRSSSLLHLSPINMELWIARKPHRTKAMPYFLRYRILLLLQVRVVLIEAEMRLPGLPAVIHRSAITFSRNEEGLLGSQLQSPSAFIIAVGVVNKYKSLPAQKQVASNGEARECQK